jgi:folate-binding protein YgfZ
MTAIVTLDTAGLRRLHAGGVAVTIRPAVFEVKGSGAVACVQGLFTNDVEKPGPGSVSYGALLTAKGAIIVDAWVLRLPDRFLFVAESEGREALGNLLRRSLPPRLAKAEDRSDAFMGALLIGPASVDGMAALPAAGHVAEQAGLLIARPSAGAPFAAMLLGSAEDVEGAVTATGLPRGSEADREAARIFAGWPRLGAEIGERTLVQEVRYDEIGGVSYTKGCYTGQETVARLHFRGHVNRELRGLLWDDAPELAGDQISALERPEAGTVTSLLRLPERLLGLGLVRREVEPGASVLGGGAPATVVALPFHLPAFLATAG